MLARCSHRYYDPELGQYISRDRLGIRAGLAAYAYECDPLTTTDALGLITGPPYDFGELMHAAQNDLDFGTSRNGAVFWSGPRMKDAQAWTTANGKTTLEQTHGGQFLDSLKLFDSGSGLSGAQAAEVWDAASLRFAQSATGEVSVFSTGAKRMNTWGNLRTWWRIERPALLRNPNVTGVVRLRILDPPLGRRQEGHRRGARCGHRGHGSRDVSARCREGRDRPQVSRPASSIARKRSSASARILALSHARYHG